jgi:hypothetical protein
MGSGVCAMSHCAHGEHIGGSGCLGLERRLVLGTEARGWAVCPPCRPLSSNPPWPPPSSARCVQVASQQGAYIAHYINRSYKVGKGGMAADPPVKAARGMRWIDRVTGSIDLDEFSAEVG